MKTRTSPNYLATGIMWSNGYSSSAIRHATKQDELTRFHWIRHDGSSFGIQQFQDLNYNMNIISSFLLRPFNQSNSNHNKIIDTESDDDGENNDNIWNSKSSIAPTWIQNFEISYISQRKITDQRDIATTYFYFGIDCDGALSSDICLSQSTGLKAFRIMKKDTYSSEISMKSLTYTIIGQTNISHWFSMDVTIQSTDSMDLFQSPSLTYWGIGKSTITESIEKFHYFRSLNEYQLQNNYHLQQSNPLYYRQLQMNLNYKNKIMDSDGTLLNNFEPNTNFIIFQVKACENYNINIQYYEYKSIINEKELLSILTSTDFPSITSNNIKNLLTNRKIEFDEKFYNVFKVKDNSNKNVESTDTENAKHALSALLGGISFAHGTPVVGDSMEPISCKKKKKAELNNNVLSSSDPTEEENHQNTLKNDDKNNNNESNDNDKCEDEMIELVSDRASGNVSDSIREPIALLSTTPSRTSFPRGFLWDEGFHLLLLVQWDYKLAMDIIRSWLAAMYVYDDGSGVCCPGGWIPREMILGDDASKRVPSEFITQRVDIANPPTLFLAIEQLLKKHIISKEIIESGQCSSSPTSLCTSAENKKRYEDAVHDMETIKNFLEEIVGPLHLWLTWFQTTQRSDSEMILNEDNSTDKVQLYRWKGRSLNDGKFLPNTLASGLDDYPRAAIPNADEYHVDLLCWMIKSTEIMSKIINIVYPNTIENNNIKKNKLFIKKYNQNNNNNNNNKIINELLLMDYNKMHQQLLESLDKAHWSEESEAYYDVGLHTDIGRIAIELLFRCSNQNGQQKDVYVAMEPGSNQLSSDKICPSDYPTLLHAIGDGRGGYLQRPKFVPDANQLLLRHVPRIGYVTLYPFMLKLLPSDSQKIESILDIIESPEHLWSSYGLRSISATDIYYKRENAPGDAPYWR